MWSSAETPMWDTSFASYEVKCSFTAPASGQFWLTTEIEGPAIVYYRQVVNDSARITDEGAMWIQWSDKVEVKAGATIQIRIVAKNSLLEETVVKGLHAYIDVPDRQEHFEDLEIPAGGAELPITTPNYETTAVHIDSVQSGDITRFPKILSRKPCKIALLDENGNQVAGTVDITWQGFVNETV